MFSLKMAARPDYSQFSGSARTLNLQAVLQRCDCPRLLGLFEDGQGRERHGGHQLHHVVQLRAVDADVLVNLQQMASQFIVTWSVACDATQAQFPRLSVPVTRKFQVRFSATELLPTWPSVTWGCRKLLVYTRRHRPPSICMPEPSPYPPSALLLCHVSDTGPVLACKAVNQHLVCQLNRQDEPEGVFEHARVSIAPPAPRRSA